MSAVVPPNDHPLAQAFAETSVEPKMPPPVEIDHAVATLIDEGLLTVSEGTVGISAMGLALLGA